MCLLKLSEYKFAGLIEELIMALGRSQLVEINVFKPFKYENGFELLFIVFQRVSGIVRKNYYIA